jgi:ATP-binding cassette subfamily B protein
MARLYDPIHGTVFLKGKDIRTYSLEEKAKSIGFILQDPIVFPGTLKDNIAYGNPEHESLTSHELHALLKEQGLDHLLERFEGGLDTPLPRNTDSMSLGQKQILAFVRAVLRKPDLLILDEATANIDTVTEQVLEQILEKLPKETTKVIIAHRLNTIQNADVIYFVNSSTVTRAGSIDDAVNMLLKGKKNS